MSWYSFFSSLFYFIFLFLFLYFVNKIVAQLLLKYIKKFIIFLDIFLFEHIDLSSYFRFYFTRLLYYKKKIMSKLGRKVFKEMYNNIIEVYTNLGFVAIYTSISRISFLDIFIILNIYRASYAYIGVDPFLQQ